MYVLCEFFSTDCCFNVSGMYLFHLTIVSRIGYARAVIQRDGTIIQAVHVNQGAESGSAVVILQLEELDAMSCWMAGGDILGMGTYGPYTHFSGFMLYPL